jgi:cellobiose phosphorylase
VTLMGEAQLLSLARALASESPHYAVASGLIVYLQRSLTEAEATLQHAYRAASRASSAERSLEPAAQWLLDNFYLLESQFREVRAALYEQRRSRWPVLRTGEGAAWPRLLLLMRELVAHADGSVSMALLKKFVAAYQESAALTLAELWATPLMLRLSILEYLQPIAAGIESRLTDAQQAAELAAQLLEDARARPADLLQSLAQAARGAHLDSPAWVTEFDRNIQSGHAPLRMVRLWLQEQMGLRQTNLDEAQIEQSQRQTLAQVSAGQCINTLRRLERMRWPGFVDELSVVESVLRRDPAGVYAAMDLATRNRYRDAVAFCAGHARADEAEVAERVLATAAAEPGHDPCSMRHVGYWLVGAGRLRLERALGVRLSVRERWWRLLQRFPSWSYVIPIVIITLTAVLLSGPEHGPLGWPYRMLVALWVAIGASQLGVALVNWAATRDVAPRPLARFDFAAGVPARWRTLVVVPCMLADAHEVEALVAGLEIRYIGNRDANVYFALLADFIDAPERVLPGDAALLDQTSAAIEALNARYAASATPRFALFYRDRQYSRRDQLWMGWERKRGKLIALNRFLRGHVARDFHVRVGDARTLRGAAYVITLDADTELPPDAAKRLIATMAHPLNRPVRDQRQHRVVAGYAVLQPRVSVGASREDASRLGRLFSEEIVLDPYTGVISNTDQDLYGETAFIGKGIYDVDAFTWATGTRFPEHRVLSHDLLEGSFARTGLVSDVELFERYPNDYRADINRRHRWIRGDWQIATWALPWVPGPRGQRLRNTLTAHQRRRIVENLLRSLVPLALLLLLLHGWLVSGRPLHWMGVVAIVMFAPALLAIAHHVAARNPRTPWRLHMRLCGESAVRLLAQAVLPLVMLPFAALHGLDAIVRSAWRLLVSRKNLLQWTPTSTATRAVAGRLCSFYRLMVSAPLLALAVALLLVAAGRANALLLAAPLLLVWATAPLVAWWLSQPAPRAERLVFARNERDWLGGIARRTWGFFEVLVGPATHELPPDNFQEYPREATAARTSPTNIGLYLASIQSALDFGYLTVGQALARISATLDTLERLARHRGHFLNWYDIHSLAPLPPAYVSTVDSGNLLACLLLLARGLEELDEERVFPPAVWRGLRDTWQVVTAIAPRAFADTPYLEAHRAAIQDKLTRPPRSDTAVAVQIRALEELTRHLDALCDAPLSDANGAGAPSGAAADPYPSWAAASDAALAEDLMPAFTLTGQESPPEWSSWLLRLRDQCHAWVDEMHERARWWQEDLLIADGCAATEDTRPLDINPTLAQALARMRAGAHDRPAGVAAADATAPATLRQMGAARALAARCRVLCQADFDFLFDTEQELLTIGYNVDTQKADEGRYDLLASEARLTSFVAVAQGRLPLDHWLALGRRLTAVGGGAALVSWSGTMFEYLMPLLFTPAFGDTLLTRTCRNVITRQIEYGAENDMPWGISESAYNVTDAQFDYQYRAFGVPGLGLKRGLAKDRVVAPYATALALPLRAHAAYRNLRTLAAMGAVGRYGFYEALDFTPSRLPENAKFALVRSFMAHHQGMILASLSAVLNGFPMQRRFLREPMFRAYQILLQEKVPVTISIDAATLHAEETQAARREQPAPMRVVDRLDTPVPELQLLSNGRWHVFVSQAGGGLSQWGELAINRWDQDGTCDATGIFCYVQDLDRHVLWSNTWQPTRAVADEYSATFAQGSAEFRRLDDDIETRTRVAVSPEDDVELRRVTVTNHGRTRRRIALTSYAELALAPRAQALAHPAFDKLFMQSEFIAASQTILVTRRPRSADEHPPTFFHLMSGREYKQAPVSHETRRDVFIGRDGYLGAPAALRSGAALTAGTGVSLDPIASVRRALVPGPAPARTVDIVSGVAPARETALALAARYADRHLASRVLDLAWTRAQVLTYQLGIGARERNRFAELASAALFVRADTRVSTPATERVVLRQSTLWKHGISGDLPIVLVHIGGEPELALVRQAVQMHRYWRRHGLAADLVIWVDGPTGYRQDVRDQVMELVAHNAHDNVFDRQGGVFVRHGTQLEPNDRAVLLASACLVLDGHDGNLMRTARAAAEVRRVVGRALIPAASAPRSSTHRLARPEEGLSSDQIGSWSADGREFRIWMEADRAPPLPWVNVLANPHFGSVVSASGGATTWSENAHEFRLTPWANDPVTDASEEAFYVRDEANGYYWSPTPLPARGPEPYLCTHGFGWSRFETIQADVTSTLTVFVARDRPIKFSVLRLRNVSRQVRTLSVWGYVGWVLGEHRHQTAAHLVTRRHATAHVVSARNPFNDRFSEIWGWFAVGVGRDTVSRANPREEGPSATGSRREFIGRNQDLRAPRALRQDRLAGAFGAAADPCAAWQVPLELAPGAERELVFLLGSAPDVEQVPTLAAELSTPRAAAAEFARVRGFWDEMLSRVTVDTPDPAMNRILNGWLPYQVMTSRLWGRSGYYQSGGAIGFRDQLQDTVSLLALDPAMARAQILLCAAHQFEQGDVLHWWHPPLARGVRTRSSDDLLWLPWAISEYLDATGDTALLDCQAPFVQGRELNVGEGSYYDFFSTSGSTANVYEHGARAIDHALRVGAHGLPLMGGGDWNDGMDRVGIAGRGESVWLAFFLVLALRRFAPLAAARGDAVRAETYAAHAVALTQAIEDHAWDGHWWRRAYTDDGTPLGSAANAECQIDSLPQSWSVLAGVGDPQRREEAIDAAIERLVHARERVIQLFDPPFDSGVIDPGYIQGYLPGTRENGGQYTHAAVWLGMALARLGRGEQAWHVFDLINPVRHADTADQSSLYMDEPYVVAADVYWEPTHRGRGGWSWYTGSAGWLYRLGLEAILGLRLERGALRIAPCIPQCWSGFRVTWRCGEPRYDIECGRATAMRNADPGTVLGPQIAARDGGARGAAGSSPVISVLLDGVRQDDTVIPLRDDGKPHVVFVLLAA